jgi:hypothetical protein
MYGNSRNRSSATKGTTVTRSMFCNKMADVMYHNNGTGRDSYIYMNNGGFSIYNELSSSMKPSRFLPKLGSNSKPVHEP